MPDHAELACQDITLTKMIKVAKHFFTADAMETETTSLLRETALQHVETDQHLLLKLEWKKVKLR